MFNFKKFGSAALSLAALSFAVPTGAFAAVTTDPGSMPNASDVTFDDTGVAVDENLSGTATRSGSPHAPIVGESVDIKTTFTSNPLENFDASRISITVPTSMSFLIGDITENQDETFSSADIVTMDALGSIVNGSHGIITDTGVMHSTAINMHVGVSEYKRTSTGPVVAGGFGLTLNGNGGKNVTLVKQGKPQVVGSSPSEEVANEYLGTLLNPLPLFSNLPGRVDTTGGDFLPDASPDAMDDLDAVETDGSLNAASSTPLEYTVAINAGAADAESGSIYGQMLGNPNKVETGLLKLVFTFSEGTRGGSLSRSS